MGESILYIWVIYIKQFTYTHTHTYITGLYIWINIQNIQRTHTILKNLILKTGRESE